ncbi:hypothetical protein GCM10022198_16200 [Klugiella xanthotipulae]|uniref:Uncharacterized protein n=1 Tax=Klugiella xanthotipulae TaxID=244735 RepID=A0A543HH46_9MICO|nr:hypothetical protein [Klugiella xanthotipulae]TQM57656.1 hypothetical protein FB466_2652 [Klugiella xanthotipulae]
MSTPTHGDTNGTPQQPFPAPPAQTSPTPDTGAQAFTSAGTPTAAPTGNKRWALPRGIVIGGTAAVLVVGLGAGTGIGWALGQATAPTVPVGFPNMDGDFDGGPGGQGGQPPRGGMGPGGSSQDGSTPDSTTTPDDSDSSTGTGTSS